MEGASPVNYVLVMKFQFFSKISESLLNIQGGGKQKKKREESVFDWSEAKIKKNSPWSSFEKLSSNS